jgi:hypothetical protein
MGLATDCTMLCGASGPAALPRWLTESTTLFGARVIAWAAGTTAVITGASC